MSANAVITDWEAYYQKPPAEGARMGGLGSYLMALTFLGARRSRYPSPMYEPTLADWGSGPGAAKLLAAESWPHLRYTGVDAVSPYADVNARLEDIDTLSDLILLRHVLEHERNWQVIFANALDRARHRLAVVLSVRMSKDKTGNTRDFWEGIPILYQAISRPVFEAMIPQDYRFQRLRLGEETLYLIERTF